MSLIRILNKNIFYFLFALTLFFLGENNCLYAHAYESSDRDGLVATYAIMSKDSIIRSTKATKLTEQLIKDRIDRLNADIELPYHKNVKSFIEYFVNKNTTYTAAMLTKSKVYFPLFEKHLKAFGLPLELKHLAVLESGLNPIAVSRVGATGLWQFMPGTSRIFGMKRDLYFDDRMDPEQATIAACKYLKQLYNTFHNWPLALASYNSGAGNVRKAIRRSGYKKTFWEIYRGLPRETRSYVPQFIAIMYAMEYANEHEIYELDSIKNTIIPVDTIFVSGYVNLQRIATDLDVDIKKISNLNPSLLRSSIPDYKIKYPLILPYYSAQLMEGRKEYFMDRARIKSEKDLLFETKHRGRGTYGREKIYYRIKKGDVLGSIAARFHLRVSNIREWNNIRGNRIYAGQRIKLYVKKGQKIAHAKSRKEQPTTVRKLDTKNNGTKTYKVKSGDTLWDIAKAFNVPIATLKTDNGLISNVIKPNMILTIK